MEVESTKPRFLRLTVVRFKHSIATRTQMKESTLTEIPHDVDAIARRAILSYLGKSFVEGHIRPRSPPEYVETKVRETIRVWNLDIPEANYEKYVVNCIHLGYAPFQHTSYDLQIAIALFSFCAMIFDDAVLVDATAIQEFVPRFCAGKRQTCRVLDHLVETSSDLCAYLHEYGANTVFSAVLMYTNQELWDGKGAKDLVLRPDAEGYIEYSRIKNGIAEPFAFSIWPKSLGVDAGEYIQAIPAAIDFIDYVNDLFSFYKESLAGDTDNYVHQYARVHGLAVEEVVEGLVHRILSAKDKVQNILGEGKVRDAWDSFVYGYTHHQLYCPRYKLDRIVPEYF